MNKIPKNAGAQFDRRILVAEDDEALALALRDTLKQQCFDVVVVPNGQAAKDLLAAEKFDLVVSDIRMPHVNGIELLAHVKKNFGTPLILMTGFSEIAETKEAHDMGARGFLAKPFKQQEFISLVRSVVYPQEDVPAPEKSLADDDFVALRIEEFVTGQEIQYDIFIRLGDDKFVKVANGGESIPMDKVTAYKQKGVHHLHLLKSDYTKYLGFTISLSYKVSASEKVQRSMKVKYLAQSTSVIVGALYKHEITPQSFEMASQVVQNTVSVLGEHQDLLSLLHSLHEHSPLLYAHSVAVSLFSALIGQKLGWRSERTIARLAAAGLLHDVGKKEIPREIIEKPRISLTSEEIALLETHCARGRQLLSMVPGIPEEVINVAMQHHENCRGQGYPLRLTKLKIAPFARIVSIANEYCKLVYPNPGQPGLDPKSALQKIKEDGEIYLDDVFLKAFFELFLSSEELKTG